MDYVRKCFVMALLFLCAASIGFAEQPEKIIKTIDGSITTRQQTLKKSADWQAQKERMKSRYFQLKEGLDLTALETGHMQEIVAKQDAYISRAKNRITEMEKIRQQLMPYLTEVVNQMESAIQSDLPFLLAERKNRVAGLREIIADPEVPQPEKMRRVFEGLRVEMDYGRSVETTKEEIEFKGQKILANVIRFGRTALMMQTLDESQVGTYNGKEWEELPSRYAGEIMKAMEITQRRRPVDFVNIPIRGKVQ
jgi:hypothetical protein